MDLGVVGVLLCSHKLIKLCYFSKKVAVSFGDYTDRTKDWIFQQKGGNIQSPGASPAACGPWSTVDKILSKLYLISSKVSSMASKATDR